MGLHRKRITPGWAFLRGRMFVMSAVVLFGSATAGAQVYTFTKIADTSQNPGIAAPACVGLNNQGTVAATFSGIQNTELWVGDGSTFTQVAPQTSSVCPSLNDLGEAAYMVDDPSTSVTTLVRNSNGVLTVLASSSDSPTLSVGGTYLPSLSLSGSAVFQGGVGGTTNGIFIGPAGTTVYDPSSGALTSATTASMNDSQTVAFLGIRADPTAPTGARTGVYRGSLMPLVEDGGPVIDAVALTRPVINNSGTVAFMGRAVGASHLEVFTTDDGVNLTVVGAGNGTAGHNRVSINNAGAVAFEGPDTAIFVGSHRLIGPEDPLDGSTVAGMFLWEEALNDHGQVVFWAELSDGRRGIYRADPPACAADISTLVAVTTKGKLRPPSKKTARYMQAISLKNGEGAFAGPVSLVLDGLSSSATLFGAAGTTTCATPPGSPYVNINVGADAVFGPGERATVTLEFVNPSGEQVTYTTRVLAGSGAR